MKKIFIVTGEHSGDVHASYVVRELKKMIPDVTVEAVGGKNLEAEGVKLFSDHSEMGVIGTDAVKAIYSHIMLGKNIVKYLKDEYKPDLVLLIDYGGFNLRLAKVLYENGIEVFYFISPQVWASRKGRLRNIKKYISKMMLILPFEEKIHKAAGVNAEFVGHPLVSQIPFDFDKKLFISENNLDPNKKIVGVFPGSRKMEINTLLEVFLKSASIIHSKCKDVQFCIGQAPNISDDLIQMHLNKYPELDIKVVKNQNYALLSCSDVLMLVSGTITLEATLYKTPMVVSYKAADIAYFLYLMLRYIKFVSLPNIIAGKKIVEEYLQYKARPDFIAEEVIGLLTDESKRNNMITELSRVNNQLGDKVASYEVAKNINEFLCKSSIIPDKRL
ncbi:MAG: lipid-A-disaccharide synthase [Candidatus Gastranaerophilales bacterium]|nr:lipid-A-disaccharide synthase [Candidatus Gastranaerophilales bacterium]